VAHGTQGRCHQDCTAADVASSIGNQILVVMVLRYLKLLTDVIDLRFIVLILLTDLH